MNMNVLFVASEMTPFIKTGGLGDVVGALPKSLVNQGVTVKAIIPLYSAIDYRKYNLYRVMDGNCVAMGNCHEFFCVHRSDYVPGVETYFVEFNKYFDRNVFMMINGAMWRFKITLIAMLSFVGRPYRWRVIYSFIPM